MAGSKHNFLLSWLCFFHASESWGIVFELVESILLRRFVYFFSKLELGEIFIIFRFGVVRRTFSLPGHPLIHFIIFGVIPTLRFGFGLPLLQPFKKHVVVHSIQLLLKNVLGIVDVAAHTYFNQTVKGFYLYFCVLV